MTPEERERYQAFLKRADEEIQTVRDNIDDGHYYTAVSRAYYAMFYAATAILLIIGGISRTNAKRLQRLRIRNKTTSRNSPTKRQRFCVDGKRFLRKVRRRTF